MVAILFKLNCALHKRFLHVLLLVFAISFEVKSGTPLRAKNTSGMLILFLINCINYSKTLLLLLLTYFKCTFCCNKQN